MKTNPKLELAYQFVEYTNKNIFLTGKAGTGKTTFLQTLKKKTSKRMVVVAPTGVAAINAGGVTIHSFFQLPFGPYIPSFYLPNAHQLPDYRQKTNNFKKIGKEKLKIIRSLELLVIDEISMVRADLLDHIDDVLRKNRKNNLPFGGVQLLMIGDIQQLAPVVKEDEWSLISSFYNSEFFFGSMALNKTNYISIELDHIFRQNDPVFIELLNNVRNNLIDSDVIDQLNKRHIPGFAEKHQEGYIYLTTHNKKAQNINLSRLDELKEKTHTFKAKTDGDFPSQAFPTDMDLNLKKGAQVMFIKNDPSGNGAYFNGKIGTVKGFEDHQIKIECEGDPEPIHLSRDIWENTRYSLNEESKEIEENIIGTFSQYPLKLAWAITIHKSQGLTFEKAIIDAQSSFAHGQVYVALSRCKSMEGMVLSTPIVSNSIKNDDHVTGFSNSISQNQPGNEQLLESRKTYQKYLLNELFDFASTQSKIFHLIKETRDHDSVLLNSPVEEFRQMNQDFKTHVMDVVTKFHKQVNLLLPENNDIEENHPLQERITKACNYFKEQFETIILETLSRVRIETDNRAVKKSITEIINELSQLCNIAIKCFKSCENGFNVKTYMETKAKALLDDFHTKTAKKQKEQKFSSSKTDDQELFDILRAWRNSEASEANLPAYMILPQKAVVNLSTFKPCTPEQLKMIKGIGKKKVEQYGGEILDIISDYCAEKGIQPDFENLEAEKPKPKKEKIDTKKLTFDLFKNGKGIKEIANERELTTNTIEGHLALYISKGEIDITELVSKEKVEQVKKVMENKNYNGLKEIKETMGNAITYGELKMAMAHLNS